MKSRFSFVQFLVFLAVLVLGIFSPLYAHRATPSANKTEKVSYNKSEFFADIAPTVQEVAEAYGVRPSLVMAQAALESDYGQKYFQSLIKASSHANITVEDIRNLADLVQAILDDGNICVIGNEDNIKKESKLFKNIETL